MARRDTYVIEFRTSGTARVQRDIASIGRQANATRRALAFLRSFLVVFASVQIFSGIFRLADAFTNLSNRLTVLSRDAQVVQSLRSEIFRLANETRLPVEDLNEVFVRISRSTLRLGLNFKELLGITETVSKAVQLGGASAQEAAGGLRQLSQGLASGALQGEELRSVAENLPRVADVIAKEFIPELKEAGLITQDFSGKDGLGGLLIALNRVKEGVLVTNRVIKAFVDEGGEINEAFSRIRPTIEQAFTVFRNRVVEFAGNLNQTTGIANTLAEGILKLSEHVDILVASFAAFVGVFTFNLIIHQLVSIGSKVVALAVLFTRFFTLLKTIEALLLKFTGLFGFLATGIALVVTATGVWEQWKGTIQETITELGGIGGVIKFVFAGVLALIQTVSDDWKLFVQALPALLARALAVVLRVAKIGLEALGNAILDRFTDIVAGTTQIIVGIGAAIKLALAGEFEEAGEILAGSFNNGGKRIIEGTVQIGESLKELAKFFGDTENAADQFGRNLESNFAEKLTVVNEAFASLSTPGARLEDLLKLPEGSNKEAENAVKKLTTAQERLRDAFKDLLASVDPTLDRLFTLAEAIDTYKNGVEFANGPTLTLAEVLKRVDREFLGIGNVVTEVAAKMENLNDAYAIGHISATELAIAQKDLNEELLGGAAELERAVSPIAAFYNELTDAQNALQLAVDRGALTQSKQVEILRRTERDLLGVGNAVAIYEERMVLLNKALQKGTISQEEFRNSARSARIEVLEDQRTLAAGIERAMLRIEEAYSDTASNVEQAFTSVFQNLEDRLVDFIETGEFSLREFLDTIRREISRVFVREAIGELSTIFNNVFGNIIPTGGVDPEAAASEALVVAKTNEQLATQAVTTQLTTLTTVGLPSVNTQMSTLGLTTLPAFNAAANSATIALNNLAAAAGAAAGASGAGGGDAFGGLGNLISSGLSLFSSPNTVTGGFGTSNPLEQGFSGNPHFAQGGSFTVGPGTGIRQLGNDNRLVPLNLQDGEQVDITPRGGRRRMGGTIVNINVSGAENGDRFKRNQNGITSRIAGAVSRAEARNR